MQKKINPESIKALALDLDGTTLLPDNTMGKRTKQCLKRLAGRGIQMMICTGRAIEGSYRYYNAIETHGPMVFFNGAEVADVPADIPTNIPKPNSGSKIKVIESRFLSLDVVDFGIDLARSMDIHFQIFVPPGCIPEKKESPWEALLIDKIRAESEMYKNHTGVTPVVTDMKAAIAAPEVKGCFKAAFITDPALHDEIRQKMLDRFGGRIYIARTYPTFLEIMDASVSKGEGLKTVMRHRGLKPEEVIAFGDEENDLPMFSVAGFSAAPANAKESVRKAADFVFGSNAEEGLAAFLQELFG